MTDFKHQFCLKICDLILFTWNKLLPSRFKLTDLLLWQQVQDELQRTKWSKIKWNQQQSNPANGVSDVQRTGPRCIISFIKKLKNIIKHDTHLLTPNLWVSLMRWKLSFICTYTEGQTISGFEFYSTCRWCFLTLAILLENQLSLLGFILVLTTPTIFTSFT